MEVFRDYALYYDAFYNGKDYNHEANQIDELIRQYGKREIHNVLNFGCGSGRHDVEFAKLGYDCDGIDLSTEMIEAAKERLSRHNFGGKYEVADIRKYTSKKKYDAVVSLFHVMSYQNTNEDIISAFKSARSCLEKGGLFIFDAWYGPGVLSCPPEVRVKDVENKTHILKRIATPIMHPNENVVDVNYEILVINKKTGIVETLRECHKMRYFFKPEIKLMLELSNMKLIGVFDCQTLGECDFNSWTSVFVSVVK